MTPEFWITLVVIAIAIAVQYAIIKGAVGAAIRANAWAIRGEPDPRALTDEQQLARAEELEARRSEMDERSRYNGV